MNFKAFFLLKNRKKGVGLPAEDVASGPRRPADVATSWRGKAVMWRVGPPRRYDVALRPRGRTRVAHAWRKRDTCARYILLI